MACAARAAVLCVLMVTSAGCLFHDAPPPRYFAAPSALTTADPAADPAGTEQPIRVRRLRAASYLGEQMAWRVSDVERGLYEQRRWTEAPIRYVERALVQTLNHTPGLRLVESGPASTLDVELVSFDEVVAPTRYADVVVVATLQNVESATVFDQAFAAHHPIADSDPASTARAIGAALDDVVRQIVAQVEQRLVSVKGSRN